MEDNLSSFYIFCCKRDEWMSCLTAITVLSLHQRAECCFVEARIFCKALLLPASYRWCLSEVVCLLASVHHWLPRTVFFENFAYMHVKAILIT